MRKTIYTIYICIIIALATHTWTKIDDVNYSLNIRNDNSYATSIRKQHTEGIIATKKECKKHNQVINPVVFVNNLFTSYNGSGIIIHKCKEEDNNLYFIITNYHVIHGIDKFANIRITVFQNRGNISGRYRAKIVAYSQPMDLAVLSIKTKKNIDSIALIPDKEIIKNVDIFDDVYAVGCPLGVHRNLVTKGIISEIINNGFISDAPASPGSSGGGTFKKHGDNYYLIGIVEKIATYNVNGEMINYISYNVSIEVVINFLEKANLSFIYSNTCPNEN